jgi:cytochrome oxidase assembly protein ShyY1
MELLRPKWVAGHLLVLVLTAAFITAGFWQIARNAETRDERSEQRAAFARPAPDIAEVDTQTAAAGNERVSATGTYDASHQWLLRGRSRGGRTGFDVLTPLRLDNGDTIIVDRGWVAADEIEAATNAANVPDGPVTVRGRLQRASELRTGETAREERGLASLPRVDTERLESDTGYDLLPAYVLAQSQDPPPSDDAPALPQPDAADSPHILYAVQWFSFAAIALIGWPIVLRRRAMRSRRR